MLGKVPGLLAIEFGKALEMFKAHGHGFDLGAVVTLSKAEDFGAVCKSSSAPRVRSPFAKSLTMFDTVFFLKMLRADSTHAD